MMLKDLVLKNRSYRGFDESVRISRETLEGFVDCARLCPSSVNKQPLKYFLAWEPEEVEKVQGLTKWARALPEMVLMTIRLLAGTMETADGLCCDLSG